MIKSLNVIIVLLILCSFRLLGTIEKYFCFDEKEATQDLTLFGVLYYVLGQWQSVHQCVHHY